MKNQEITKEKFKEYCRQQYRGTYNMFDPRARQMTSLTRDEWFDIMKHYERYMKKYPNVRKEVGFND